MIKIKDSYNFYGAAYAVLGVMGILTAFFNQRFIALVFLLIVIIVSATSVSDLQKKLLNQSSK